MRARPPPSRRTSPLLAAAVARPALAALAALALLAGCLRPESQSCGNGGICPPGLLCVDTGGTTSAGRVCAAGTCGDGRRDASEVCDDGNNFSGDGCPADCTAPCGDSVRDPDEVCDDGNLLSGDGCSADCRALDGLFLVSPSSVSVSATESEALPAPVTITVQLPQHGDAVLVDFAPGVPPPSWLSITEGATTASSAELELQVTDTSTVGERATTVRLTIRRDATSGGVAGLAGLAGVAGVASDETFELPVRYRVEPSSDLALTVAPETLVFAAISGDLAVPPRAVAVAFNGESVALLASPPWLTVSAPDEPTRSPATYQITVNDTSSPAGTQLTGQLVFQTRRGARQRIRSVPVDYHLFAPPPLVVQTAPEALTFAALAGGELPASQQLTAAFNGLVVEVVEQPPWLAVVGPAAPAISPAQLTVAVTSTAFPAGTTQFGALVLRTRWGAAQALVSVPLAYHVVAQPIVDYVAPYVGVAGRAGTLILRGRGFPTFGPVPVRLGAQELGPVWPESATQLTLRYPALPAGRYPVTVLAPSGSPPLDAPELIITPPPGFAYQALAAPGSPSQLLYDAERQELYAVNGATEHLERFRFANGTWSALPPHPIPGLRRLALAPDGRSLLVAHAQHLSEISLSGGPFTLVPRITLGDISCDVFIDAAATNDGKLLLLSELSGSGACPSYLYDLRDHSLLERESVYSGTLGASSDGSRIYIGSHDPLQVYDARAGTMSELPNGPSPVYRLSVSGDGSRVLASHDEVRDRGGRLLGYVPYFRRGTLVSRDGTRAFAYFSDEAGHRLEVYDLTAPLQPGALYPLLGSIALPDAASDGPFSISEMATTPDDSVVFIIGATRLLIVPVGGFPGRAAP